MIVHGKRNNEFDDNFYIRRFNDKISLDTYMTVISEVHCGDSDETMFISEKTFKLVAAEHPFIVVGNKLTLKYLRDLGYQTFDPLIDETYDTIEDDDIRMEHIVNELNRLCNLSDSELIAFTNNVKDIVEHNYNHFRNTSDYRVTKNVVELLK